MNRAISGTLFAPAFTSASFAAAQSLEIARLNEADVKGDKSPEFVKRMTEMDYAIVGGTPEQMVEISKVKTARWGPIVKASGAKVD